MPKVENLDDREADLPAWLIYYLDNPVFRWSTMIVFGPLLWRNWHSRWSGIDRDLFIAWFLGNVLWASVIYWVFFEVMA